MCETSHKEEVVETLHKMDSSYITFPTFVFMMKRSSFKLIISKWEVWEAELILTSALKDLQINLQARSFINILLSFTDMLENISYSLWTHFYSRVFFSIRLAADLVYHIAALDIKFVSRMSVFLMPGIYTECLESAHRFPLVNLKNFSLSHSL